MSDQKQPYSNKAAAILAVLALAGCTTNADQVEAITKLGERCAKAGGQVDVQARPGRITLSCELPRGVWFE